MSVRRRIKLAWRAGFPSRGVDPKAAADEIDRIMKANGGKLDAAALASAVGKRSPLAPLFETDAGKALQLWREEQARGVMRSLWDATNDLPYLVSYRISYEDPPEDHPTGRQPRQYVPVATIKKDPDIEAKVMAEALQGLIAWERRYRRFARYLKLQPVVRLVREAISKAA